MRPVMSVMSVMPRMPMMPMMPVMPVMPVIVMQVIQVLKIKIQKHSTTVERQREITGKSNNRDGNEWDFVYRNLESLGYYKNGYDILLQHKKEPDANRASKHKTLRQMENEDMLHCSSFLTFFYNLPLE